MQTSEPSHYLVLASFALVAVLHWLSGLVIFLEGLNKLERSAPLQRGLRWRARVVVLMKVFAWIALVAGAGGALVRPIVVVAIGGDLVVGPIYITDRVSLADALVLAGFALLIVRTRLKEGVTP
jgi:hypothetical protein